MGSWTATATRLIGLIVLSGLCLQVYFLARVALMRVVDPQSTTFQRSEIRRIVATQGQLPWRQEWADNNHLSVHLKRAVIASEDANFVNHHGIEVDALHKAWQRNAAAQERAQQRAAAAQARHERAVAHAMKHDREPPPPPTQKTSAKVVGGSTITQQLAKNLFLSKERNVLRKAQEIVLAWMLEACLSKERILTLYLNNVEWGEGVFGAEAASQHYFRTSAQSLSAQQAARLAVMLPAPKRFEQQPRSSYIMRRAATIVARMRAVQIP